MNTYREIMLTSKYAVIVHNFPYKNLTFWTNLYSLYNISENVRHILKQNISSSKDLYTEYNRLNPIKSYPLHF